MSRPRPSESSQLIDWRLAPLLIGGIIAVVVVRTVVADAQRVLGWAIAAAIVAMLLDPVVDRLDRRLPRPLALAVTFVTIVGIGLGLAVVYWSSLRTEIDRLTEAMPAVAEDVEGRGDRLGELARSVGLTGRVEELAQRFDEAVGSGTDTIRSASLSAPAYFVSMILTIFFVVFGPRMVGGAICLLPDERRSWASSALHDGVRRTQAYVWASIAQAVSAGITITVVAVWFDAPAPPLVGLAGAVCALIPYVGIPLGFVPLLMIGVGVADGWQVIVALGVLVAMVALEVSWWRPRVHRRSLYVGPAVPLIAAVLGAALYGIGGALHAMALSVLALAAVDQFDRSDDELPTPTDGFEEDPNDD